MYPGPRAASLDTHCHSNRTISCRSRPSCSRGRRSGPARCSLSDVSCYRQVGHSRLFEAVAFMCMTLGFQISSVAMRAGYVVQSLVYRMEHARMEEAILHARLRRIRWDCGSCNTAVLLKPACVEVSPSSLRSSLGQDIWPPFHSTSLLDTTPLLLHKTST